MISNSEIGQKWYYLNMKSPTRVSRAEVLLDAIDVQRLNLGLLVGEGIARLVDRLAVFVVQDAIVVDIAAVKEYSSEFVFVSFILSLVHLL